MLTMLHPSPPPYLCDFLAEAAARYAKPRFVLEVSHHVSHVASKQTLSGQGASTHATLRKKNICLDASSAPRCFWLFFFSFRHPPDALLPLSSRRPSACHPKMSRTTRTNRNNDVERVSPPSLNVQVLCFRETRVPVVKGKGQERKGREDMKKQLSSPLPHPKRRRFRNQHFSSDCSPKACGRCHAPRLRTLSLVFGVVVLVEKKNDECAKASKGTRDDDDTTRERCV